MILRTNVAVNLPNHHFKICFDFKFKYFFLFLFLLINAHTATLERENTTFQMNRAFIGICGNTKASYWVALSKRKQVQHCHLVDRWDLHLSDRNLCDLAAYMLIELMPSTLVNKMEEKRLMLSQGNINSTFMRFEVNACTFQMTLGSLNCIRMGE